MKLSDLFPERGIRGTVDAAQVEISDICDHTEDIKRGALFVASPGLHTNPLSLLHVIEEKGAAAILLPSEAPLPRTTALPCFFADDLADLLPQLWARFFSQPAQSLRLFAVTGTNGKTSVALILAHLLNHAGIPTAYMGTLGTDFRGERIEDRDSGMTTPSAHRLHERLRTLSQMGAVAVVMEISSHAIAQKRTAHLRFEAALFTNLTEDHLDYHKTMENYFSVKSALFAQTDFAIINRDDDYGERLLTALTCEKQSVGVIEEADFTVTDLHENGDERTEYKCCTPFGGFPVSYPLFGAFHVYNTLLSIAAAVRAGLCPAEIQSALSTLPTPKGRLEKLPIQQGFSVIIDYAHTPDAMEQAIKATRRVCKGRLLVLFGAGGDREREKRSVMGRIACRLADHVFITQDNPREEDEERIFRDVLSGTEGFFNYTVLKDRKKAITTALDLLEEGDTLLLLGKGHEEYMIRGREKTYFSEREIIKEYLREKKVK